MITPFGWFDITNSAFEWIGSLMVWMNVRQILKDKSTAGINLYSTIFFVTWASWNVFYYYYISQWSSMIGAIPLALGDIVWLALMFKYRKK